MKHHSMAPSPGNVGEHADTQALGSWQDTGGHWMLLPGGPLRPDGLPDQEGFRSIASLAGELRAATPVPPASLTLGALYYGAALYRHNKGRP